MIINEDGTVLGGSDKPREAQAASAAGTTPDDSELPPYTPTSTTLSSVSADSFPIAGSSPVVDPAPQSPSRVNIDVSISSSSSREALGGGSGPGQPVPNLRPVNFLALTRTHQPSSGQYVLDPTLSVPKAALAPLGEGEKDEDRKNLSVKCTTAPVSAEVWVVSGSGSGSAEKKRATIQVQSEHGPVSVTIYTPEEGTPVALTARSKTGPIAVYLPRTFRGAIRTSTVHGPISFSDALTQNVTVFSDIDNRRHGFIGEVAGSGWGEVDSVWKGDEVEVETSNGPVRIAYADEPSPSVSGLISRLTSMFTG